MNTTYFIKGVNKTAHWVDYLAPTMLSTIAGAAIGGKPGVYAGGGIGLGIGHLLSKHREEEAETDINTRRKTIEKELKNYDKNYIGDNLRESAFRIGGGTLLGSVLFPLLGSTATPGWAKGLGLGATSAISYLLRQKAQMDTYRKLLAKNIS